MKRKDFRGKSVSSEKDSDNAEGTDAGDFVRPSKSEEAREKLLNNWVPKTEAGRLVKSGQIESLDGFFAKGYSIMEPEIVDFLVPDLKTKLIEFRKTSRTTRQGRSFSFRASVLVGDGSKYIGIGTAKDRERFPAINKATRNAKKAIGRVIKGCGSWECKCGGSHSIPFKVVGRCASVTVELLPAPKGTGNVVGDKIKDVLNFVDIKDVWSKSSGNTSSALNFVTAAVRALVSTSDVRLSEDMKNKLGDKK